MAQVPYSEGVSTVAPEATTPNDYQSSSAATPDAFGGQLAQGAEKLGHGMFTSAQFFGKVAADDASNQLQDYATKLLHGDPSKTIQGPNGPMPDTGYLGTRGRATLDQRPQIEQGMDDKVKELRANLQSPEQQIEFDNFTRRYRSMVSERIGSHADGQATTWYSGVNTATAKLAMDHIANNFDNPNEVSAGFSDLTSAYVKNAQLQGAQPGDPQFQEALDAAKRDGLQAQLNAMAVKDPSRALAILDKNKDVAGIKYDDMARSFRARATQQQGFDIGEQALKKTYESQPASGYQAAALTQAGAPYGVSGSYLQRVQQLETGNNPNQTSSTGAKGAFQFTGGTAQRYGLKDPFNYQESADAAARLTADNRDHLGQSLGRPPTDAELYLAHQQGAGGAATLLQHPNVRAGDLVGDQAIRVNGGDPNAPASAFTSMWTAKFNGAPGAAMATRKASAFQTIMGDGSLDPEVRQHALTYVSQQLNASAIAEEQDAKATKARNDALQGQLVSEIIKGASPDVIQKIANSGLSATEMENLYKFATEQGGVPTDAQYGPGYPQAFKSIMAAQDDPSRITDVGQIIARGGPGGDLTKRGVTELIGVMDKIRKQPDQAGISTVKAKQLEYYQNQFAIDQNFNIPGMKPFKNQKGLDKFDHDFVPAFESAYADWVGQGKNPMDFLTDNKKIDAIMNRVYPQSQRAADAMKGDDSEGQDKGQVPPAPAELDAKTWQQKGDWPYANWAAAIERLRADPSDEVRKAFNSKFGPAGYTAEDILKRLPPNPFEDPSGGPAPPADAHAVEPLPPTKPLLERIPQTLLPPKYRTGAEGDAARRQEEEDKKNAPSLTDMLAGVSHALESLGPKKDMVVRESAPIGIRG
jgi:hypothetical protein